MSLKWLAQCLVDNIIIRSSIIKCVINHSVYTGVATPVVKILKWFHASWQNLCPRLLSTPLPSHSAPPAGAPHNPRHCKGLQDSVLVVSARVVHLLNFLTIFWLHTWDGLLPPMTAQFDRGPEHDRSKWWEQCWRKRSAVADGETPSSCGSGGLHLMLSLSVTWVGVCVGGGHPKSWLQFRSCVFVFFILPTSI